MNAITASSHNRRLARLARLSALAWCALASALADPVAGRIDARLMREADVSATQIAFVYAGDIWVAPKEGGTAARLSSPRGEESFPRFSPDGAQIAFTGDYDGNEDLYVMPAGGGLPRRLTYHGAPDRMLAWYPDGKSILFASARTSEKDRFNKLFRLSLDGGLPEQLPVPYGEFGSISPDGRYLAYMPISRDFRTWKRYRGGMAPDIWLFDLREGTAENLTHNDANDAQPMWHGNTLYFLSDRDANQRANIWACDLATRQFRQLTFFQDFDTHFPGMGPEEIILENGGRLYLLDLGTENLREVEIRTVTDQATLKPRIENVSGLIQDVSISPTGKRAVVEARGDVFTVPAENGVVRNLTRSSGVAERYPAWSPDGKWVAYFSDRSGEYELTLRAADGSGEERKLTSLGAGFRYAPVWSPDSQQLAFIDQAMRLYVHGVDPAQTRQIDHLLWLFHGELEQFHFAWSPDSRWLAYAGDQDNRNTAIVLYDAKEHRRLQVTSGFYNDEWPVFDPDGKYLFYRTGRSFDPIYSDLDNSWIYANTAQLVAVPLRKDVPSLLAPRNDEEPRKDQADAKQGGEVKDGAKPAEAKAGDHEPGEKKDKPETPPKPVEIDLAGFERRAVVLPPKPGRYGELVPLKDKLLFRRLPRTGSGEDKSPIAFWDFEKREEKTVLDDADAMELSADRQKLLVRKGKEYAIIEPKEGQKMEKKLALGALEATVDPVAEWRQIFTEAWRIERDYFYDPGMHGVNWEAMRRRYGKLLDDAVTRWDVNFLLGELIAELNSSHTYRSGGDLQAAPQRGVGYLGVDFALEDGAYRIEHILEPAAWDAEVRSPLRQPGIDVKEGDYLLAVNGVPLDPKLEPWAAFQGLADKTVSLTVNRQPTGEGAREVIVQTLASEARLRNLAWIEAKRRRVDEASDGRIGYIYVPDTGQRGQNELVRQFRGQFTKQGLIVDERFNSGGQIPDRFIELLNRPLINYWGVRDGRDWQWPPVAHFGPQAMLVNGWSGSGGDAFPYYFKHAGLGPLIGTRTWGGLIGISGAPTLVDGGNVTAPTFGIYSPKGKWIIEGHGVDPDIEVIDDPAKLAKGIDPQLERAIRVVEEAIEKNPPPEPHKPAYPDRAGKTDR